MKMQKKYQFIIFILFFLYFCNLEKETSVMKKSIGLILTCLLMLLTTGCGGGEKAESQEEPAIDSIPLLVSQIQRCSRLYTTEYRIHKLISCESNRQVSGFGISFGIDIFGDRKIIIPMDATLKGYIDMNQLKARNIERQGEKITITLPDPEIMMTSTKIDHENIKEFVTGFRDDFTDQEMASFEAQGRKAIINEIPDLGIERTARENAVRILVPIITQMGFREQDITIQFRTDYNPHDLIRRME